MARAPWTAIPATRSTAPVLKIRLWLVLGTLLVCAAIGVFSGLAWISGSKSTGTAATQPVATGFATTIAEDYLAGRPTTLPVATGLSQDLGLTRAPSTTPGASTTPAAPIPVAVLAPEGYSFTPPATPGGRFLETHSFLVETADTPPHLYNLTVVVDVTTVNHVLAAYPTLQPKVFTGTAPGITYGQGTNSTWLTSVPAATIAAANQWGTYFVTDNQQGLQQLVGDPNAAVGDFRGLTGFTAPSSTPVTIVGGFTKTDGSDVLHVTLAMTPKGANGVTMSSDYDLLVAYPGTQTPKVVAWGPAGTGPTLVAYQNNINGAGAGS